MMPPPRRRRRPRQLLSQRRVLHEQPRELDGLIRAIPAPSARKTKRIRRRARPRRPPPLRRLQLLVVETHEFRRATLHMFHRVQHGVHGLAPVRLFRSRRALRRGDAFAQRRDLIRGCVVAARRHRVGAHGVEGRGDPVDDVLEHRLESGFGLLERGVGVGAAPVREISNLGAKGVAFVGPGRDVALDAPDRLLHGRELGSQRGVGRVARAAVLVASRARRILRLRHPFGQIEDPELVLRDGRFVRGDEVEDAFQTRSTRPRGDGRGRQLELGRRGGARRSGRDRHGDGGHRAGHSERRFERNTGIFLDRRSCLGTFGFP